MPLAQALQSIFSETKEATIKKVRQSMENTESRKIFDRRTIKLEDVMKSDYIPFLSGRPERETVIGADDLLNLSILLNTTEGVEAFLRKI
jgi:hypothetical protein